MSARRSEHGPRCEVIPIAGPSQVAGQYIRMKSKTLKVQNVAYGPSLYEFEVFGAP